MNKGQHSLPHPHPGGEMHRKRPCVQEAGVPHKRASDPGALCSSLSAFRLNHFLLPKGGTRNYWWNPRWRQDQTPRPFPSLCPLPQRPSPRRWRPPSPLQRGERTCTACPPCRGSSTCLAMKRSALLTASVPMTTPGGARGAIATWAKVVRAAQKVGACCGEAPGPGWAPLPGWKPEGHFCCPPVALR